MKKPPRAPDRGDDLASLKLRVAHLERASAALSARMLSLFGPATKPVEVVAPGAPRPAIGAAAR